MKNFLYFLLLLLATTSCVSRIDRHGYIIDLSDIDSLQEGVSSKETVLRLMGSPTVISDLGATETWIYYSEEVKNVLFFMPDIVARNVIGISFDENAVIKEMQSVDLSQESKNMNFASNYTKVESHKIGAIKAFFSNIGQIKPQ